MRLLTTCITKCIYIFQKWSHCRSPFFDYFFAEYRTLCCYRSIFIYSLGHTFQIPKKTLLRSGLNSFLAVFLTYYYCVVVDFKLCGTRARSVRHFRQRYRLQVHRRRNPGHDHRTRAQRLPVGRQTNGRVPQGGYRRPLDDQTASLGQNRTVF